ncbi:MAG: hypothetical protein RQ752_05625 [Thermohalobaculum sp.]|nr:hypothetical protein [Thermohalobaculum sp.]
MTDSDGGLAADRPPPASPQSGALKTRLGLDAAPEQIDGRRRCYGII